MEAMGGGNYRPLDLAEGMYSIQVEGTPLILTLPPAEYPVQILGGRNSDLRIQLDAGILEVRAEDAMGQVVPRFSLLARKSDRLAAFAFYPDTYAPLLSDPSLARRLDQEEEGMARMFLVPGDYVITAQAFGFRPWVSGNIHMAVGQRLTIKAVLEPGQ